MALNVLKITLYSHSLFGPQLP